jgi:formate/nitrite transporter FocA (FNT family)
MPDESVSTRPTAREIYERVQQDAQDELERTPGALAFSAVFAGFTIGATPLAEAAALALLHGSSGAELVAALVYPLGFIAAVIGRAQLFTENTLYPVVASLEDRRYILPTARLWVIVWIGNLIGVVGFAAIVSQSGGIAADLVDQLRRLGADAAEASFTTIFWSGFLAGWVLALVAWLVEASDAAIGQVVVVWTATVVIGLAALDHCVATTVSVVGAAFGGDITVGRLVAFVGTATLGNVVGGVLIVALLNYGQARGGLGGGRR